MTGTTPTYLGAEDYQLEAGRQLTSADVTNHALVVVIGQDLVTNLYDRGTNPIGTEISFGADPVPGRRSAGQQGIQQRRGPQRRRPGALHLGRGPADRLRHQLHRADRPGHRRPRPSTRPRTRPSDILASDNDTSVANLPFTLINESSLAGDQRLDQRDLHRPARRGGRHQPPGRAASGS